MITRLYIGNLSSHTTEGEIRTLFSEHGTVESVNFIRHFDSGEMRGFGFLEVATRDAAIMVAEMNGREVGGRALKVNEARPRGDARRRPSFRP
jgi:RNA recognition motif-containing protein